MRAKTVTGGRKKPPTSARRESKAAAPAGRKANGGGGSPTNTPDGVSIVTAEFQPDELENLSSAVGDEYKILGAVMVIAVKLK